MIKDNPIDWDVFVEPEKLQSALQLARCHGLEALVIDRLAAHGRWLELSAGLRDQLKPTLKIAATLQLARAQDLISASKAAEQGGARFLVLKEGGLASSHYHLPYLRSRCDTDIFIDLKKIRLICSIFLGLGYKESGQVYKSPQFNFESLRFAGMAVQYDLHWRVSSRGQYSRFLSFEEANYQAVLIDGLLGVRGLKPVHALQKSMEIFETNMPTTAISALEVSPPIKSFTYRFRMSQLGLILDDLRELPDISSRIKMVSEYLFPSGDYLLDRYEKNDRIWIPILYCRFFS